ncbi:MAG: hypothetical protein Q9182_007073 [Xanthomendoza sp. 2 TL-2023]
MSGPATAEKKSKFKSSSLFCSKDKPASASSAADTKDPLSQRNSNTDSGYGGSNFSVTEATNHAPPSLTGSDESRFDRNNDNQTVTATTTTTTTTTTTSGGQLFNTTVENNGPASDYISNRTDGGAGSPPIPAHSSLRERSPQPPPMQQSNAGPLRDRSPVAGTSPNRTSFPYPNRGGGMTGQQMTPQQQHNQGTLQGFKSAAVGFHGASETLRGTLNSAIDRRTGALAERLADHDRVLAADKHEMDTGRMPENRPSHQIPPKGILKRY